MTINTRSLLILLSLTVTLLLGCAGNRHPIEAKHLIAASGAIGLVAATDFNDSSYSETELEEIRRDDTDWYDHPKGARSVHLANYPYKVAVHETSFSIRIYQSKRYIELVIISAPVVNGSREEADLMLETMYAVAEALLPTQKDLQEWIDASWKDSWDHYFKENINRSDVIKERQIGDYLVAVSGVPPDLIWFYALRRPWVQ